MSNIESVVNSLENRIGKILHKMEVLKQTSSNLSEELAKTQERLLQQDELITSWEEKYNTLKMANSLLGSDDNKKETKLKINGLIREIDHCIGQLSE
jgi:chromosome segregation ATPase